jgi:hypothetical protein
LLVVVKSGIAFTVPPVVVTLVCANVSEVNETTTNHNAETRRTMRIFMRISPSGTASLSAVSEMFKGKAGAGLWFPQ